MAPYVLDVADVDHCFGYDYRQAPSGCGRLIQIQRYKWNKATREILLSYFEDVFLTEKSNDKQQNLYEDLEDFCLYSDQDLIIGTVTHEYLLSIHTIDPGILNKLTQFGKWKAL